MELRNVKSPDDLNGLDVSQLEYLAEQLREMIIGQVSETGGHLAPSLGVIELTLALHQVYDSPKDKVIWDVGHQAYAHKIICGRYDSFSTIRQENGITGFPKRKENEHDAFGVGHASTSISAALGYCSARNRLKQDYSVVAVIGDGAMTGGTAFEALNNASSIHGNLTIVLNDNKMAISESVGALSSYLNDIITDPIYNKIRSEIKNMTKADSITGKLASLIGTFQDAAKHVLMTGNIFEDLGIRYFGPINGHDIKTLTQIFKKVKNLNEPCLVHVITEKGRGWEFSEKDSYKWHGTVPFNPNSGEQVKSTCKSPSYTKVFGDALTELASVDPKIMGITAAMLGGCGLSILQKDLPERVVDVGIAEGHAVTFAAGLACGGVKPVVAVYSTFLQRAIDHIIHDVALQQLPVVFVIDRAGLVGADGPTHHGTFDITYMRMIPGMVVMAPSDQDELRNMLYTAINHNGPISMRFPRGNAPACPKSSFENIEIGSVKKVKEGSKVLFLGLGSMVKTAKEASELLSKKGIDATIIDARFAKPLYASSYENLLKSHDIIVTLEENVLSGGYGSGILELMQTLKVKNKEVINIGIPDSFVEQGEVDSLLAKIGMDAKSVSDRVLDTIKEFEERA